MQQEIILIERDESGRLVVHEDSLYKFESEYKRFAVVCTIQPINK